MICGGANFGFGWACLGGVRESVGWVRLSAALSVVSVD